MLSARLILIASDCLSHQVRHEAAEALGAIGTTRAIEVLREYAGDEEEIVRESCWVALMWLE